MEAGESDSSGEDVDDFGSSKLYLIVGEKVLCLLGHHV